MKRKHLKAAEEPSRASYRPPWPTGGAIARYENNSHSGSTWYDQAAVPANGTDGGTPGFWPVFDGLSGVDLGRPAKLDFAGAFTCSFWAKQSVDAPPGSERVVARDDSVGGIRTWVVTSGDPGGVITAYIWGVGFAAPGYKSVTTPVSPLGVWHYTTFINEGAGGDLVAFIDGAEQGRAVGSGGVLALQADNTQIGRENGSTAPYQGTIDTVRFYSRALSANEILRDYYAGKPAHP